MSDYNSILTAAVDDEKKLTDFISYIKGNSNESEWLDGIDKLIETYGYRKPLFPLIAALWLSIPNGTRIFARHRNMFIKVVNKADNADAFFFALAKELFLSHHKDFAEMKIHTHLMLNQSLDVECKLDDNIVEWLAYNIYMKDWESLSLNRVLNFEGSEDEKNWIDNHLSPVSDQ